MKSRRKFYKSAIPAALCALVVLFGPAVARAQHGGGGGGGGHTDEAHDTDPGHLLHDPGHGGQRGGGHGDGGTGGHGSHEGRRGAGRADIEDTIFRWGGEGYRGGIEERIFRQEQRPFWAGGAVPEDLELGRLNVARAPASTRERALQEVYSSNLDKDGDGNIDADADLGTVDSPVANLALYEQALEQGSWTLSQAAMFLGHASDKTIPISVQTVEAVNLILGIPTDDTGISGFSYDRNAAYPAEIVNAVFDGQAYVGSGIDAFARAADDERAVTLYLHDHPEALPGS